MRVEPKFPLRYEDDLGAPTEAVHDVDRLREIAQGVLDDCLYFYRDADGKLFDLKVTAIELVPVNEEA